MAQPRIRLLVRLPAAAMAIIVVVTLFIGRSSSAITYVVVDLATIEQGSTAVVRGPNAAGDAVGGGRVAGARRGLLFTRGGVQEISGFSGSDYTTVFGIDDVGAVAVGSSNTTTAARAFRTTRAGAIRELPPLVGDTAGTAFAVNKLGQAVGFSSGSGGEQAVLWAADDSVTALPGVSGAQASRALGINERGDAVGSLTTGSGLRAILWPRGGSAQDLGTLPGHTTSEAVAVNARGDVVGYSADAIGGRRAVLWPSGGMVVNLGTLPGGDFSQSLGINDAGNVVGVSTSALGSRAFIWTPTTGLRDLNDLIAPSAFVLTQAVGINAAGVIVALGRDDGHSQAGDHDAHEFPLRIFLLLPSGAQP
jgi:probable HAF family extracellular repeat protein